MNEITDDEPIQILCVDDEPNVLKAMQRLFLDEDYEILLANSGAEGLTILEQNPAVQLVISDYRMPGMNGVDFLKDVCDRRPETVRIVLSGYADTAAVVSAINEGQIYKFIPKPWDDDELLVNIRNALEKYELERKNALLMKELAESNAKLQEVNQNLEDLVAKRTATLTLQNQVLAVSQNILDALPAAVLGIDSDRMVVCCNHEGTELFARQGMELLGLTMDEVLPVWLVDFVHTFPEQDVSLCQRVEAEDGLYRICGTRMKNSGQEGLVLLVEWES